MNEVFEYLRNRSETRKLIPVCKDHPIFFRISRKTINPIANSPLPRLVNKIKKTVEGRVVKLIHDQETFRFTEGHTKKGSRVKRKWKVDQVVSIPS